MYSNRKDVFGFGDIPLQETKAMPYKSAAPKSVMPQAIPLKLDALSNPSKFFGAALIFFLCFFAGSLAIANSSSDMKPWRAHALADSRTALLGVSFTAGGAWILRRKKDAS